MLVGKHSWQHEVKRWSEPWPFDRWLEAVCQGRRLAANLARDYYAAQWDPPDCREYVLAGGLFKKAPKSRVVVLDDAAIQKRIAKGVWTTCNALLARKLTDSARRTVAALHVKMGAQAGINKE